MLYISDITIHSPAVLYLVPDKMLFSSSMICIFAYVKTYLYPESNIFLMEISELCISPTRIFPPLSVSGSCNNDNLHSLVDIIFPPFVSPTVIGDVLNVVFSWRLLVFM